MRIPYLVLRKFQAGGVCGALILATQTVTATAQHLVAPRGIPVRFVPVIPVGSLGNSLPAATASLSLSPLPVPALQIPSLTAPELVVPSASSPASLVSRVAVALVSRRDAPGLVGVIGHRVAGAQGETPAAASFVTPSEEVRASAGASKEWGETSFRVLMGEKSSLGNPVIVSREGGALHRVVLGRPRGSTNPAHRPGVSRPAVRANGFKPWMWGTLLAIGMSGLGVATGLITNMFEFILIVIAANLIPGWLASRKAAREKAEEEARKEAEKREFIRRLRGAEALPVSDPTPGQEASGPAMSERFGALNRFLESWPGAVLVAGAGLAAALYAGVIAVDFLPDLAKYVALAVPSLVLPALGRDWLAGRLTGTSSPRGLLARISPLMTMAVPAVAFVFTGILFGRAKSAADAGLSSSHRAAVALAGPAVNVALALVGAAAAAGLAWVGAGDVIVSLISTFIIVNVMTALLDLLPAYPFAGHDVVRHLVGHVFAAPRAAAWLDRHPGLQLAVLAGVLFIGGGLLNEAVLRIFGVLYWPAAWASVP